MATEIKQEKELVLKRVPPGDRSVFATTPNGQIWTSLTDALEAWYQNTGDTQFYMDARKGAISVVKEQEIEVPLKRFSLYGED
jgi:hypothetical protein